MEEIQYFTPLGHNDGRRVVVVKEFLGFVCPTCGSLLFPESLIEYSQWRRQYIFEEYLEAFGDEVTTVEPNFITITPKVRWF